ncbi:MAG: GNAT family N-acetyltransferase [Candidatus Thorarchaeota archaeon]
MTLIELKDLNMANIDDLINLCIPHDKKNNPLFIKGNKLKKKWIEQNLKKYGSIAKLAFSNSKPIGFIQYLPDLSEQIIEITCIFVPDKEYHRKGVGSALLKALIQDMKKPQYYFNKKPPLALVTNTFDVPGWFSQKEFFKHKGFQKVSDKYPFLLYYPIKQGFVYLPQHKGYIPQSEDEGTVIIFLNPSCPFSVSFAESIKKLIEKTVPQTPIRIINQFNEPEEFKKRGKISFCVVNGKPIKTFFTERDSFLKEVKNALSD